MDYGENLRKFHQPVLAGPYRNPLVDSTAHVKDAQGVQRSLRMLLNRQQKNVSVETGYPLLFYSLIYMLGMAMPWFLRKRAVMNKTSSAQIFLSKASLTPF
jgi:hypothetical protein